MVLVFSLVQPLMWMVFFGFLFHRYALDGLPGNLAYLDFLMPGICVMTVLFGASQSGISLIRDMQTGYLQRLLGTPAASETLLAGKLLADLTRLIGQGAAVALLGLALGARLQLHYASLAVAVAHLVLFAFSYACLSCWIALATRSQEAMGVLIQALNMPLLFTSSVLVPARQMPDWLAAVARWNPLSPVAEGLREGLLSGGGSPATGFTLALAVLASGSFLAARSALDRHRVQ